MAKLKWLIHCSPRVQGKSKVNLVEKVECAACVQKNALVGGSWYLAKTKRKEGEGIAVNSLVGKISVLLVRLLF